MTTSGALTITTNPYSESFPMQPTLDQLKSLKLIGLLEA